MEKKPEGRELTLENWSEFSLDDLGEQSREQRIWNRFVVLKQAEINTMLRMLPEVARKKERVDTLSSAQPDGGSDPLPDQKIAEAWS